jgi:hypothetical protein
MREIDVMDEALIGAGPAVVYQAILDELTGKTHWSPYVEMKPRGEIPANQVGGIVDITVHRPGTPKFTSKTIEVIENKMVRFEYVEGDYSGEGQWTLEPMDDSTQVRFRWHVQPRRWLLRMLAPFIDIGKIHSEIMKFDFEGLSRHVGPK